MGAKNSICLLLPESNSNHRIEKCKLFLWASRAQHNNIDLNKKYLWRHCRFLVCTTAALTCHQVGDVSKDKAVQRLNDVINDNNVIENDDSDVRVKRATFMPFRSEKFMSKQVDFCKVEWMRVLGKIGCR